MEFSKLSEGGSVSYRRAADNAEEKSSARYFFIFAVGIENIKQKNASPLTRLRVCRIELRFRALRSAKHQSTNIEDKIYKNPLNY